MALLAVRRMLQAVHAVLVRVQPAEDAGPARTARGDGRVRLGEANPLLGKGVDVGRLDHRIAVAAKLHAEIVGDDEDDVLLFDLGVSGRGKQSEKHYEQDAAHGWSPPGGKESVRERPEESTRILSYKHGIAVEEWYGKMSLL